MALVHLEQISFAYPNNPVLAAINLEIHPGEIVAIIGSSGVGKTTLFNLIAGLLPLQEGRIRVDGSDDIAGKVSYMLQKDLLLEHKTVLGNVILPLQIAGVSKKEAQAFAKEKLEQFDLLDTKDKYPSELSGGMRQRIALLRTTMFQQKLFLLDEAFSALDALTKRELHTWYRRLHEELDLTTLLITHDIDEAITLADRIYVLKHKPGRIVATFTNDEETKDSKSLAFLNRKNEILSSLGL